MVGQPGDASELGVQKIAEQDAIDPVLRSQAPGLAGQRVQHRRAVHLRPHTERIAQRHGRPTFEGVEPGQGREAPRRSPDHGP